MKDRYPDVDAIDPACLVEPQWQPEYLPLPGYEIDPFTNAGHELSDAQVAAGLGDQPAAVHHETGRVWTYAELAEHSSRLAQGLLRLGLRAGERVAYRMPNRPEAIVAALAIWKAGGVVVPTPAQARPAELNFFLTDTHARFVIVDGRPDFADDLAAALNGTAVQQVIVLDDPVSNCPHTGWHRWSELVTDSAEPVAPPAVPADQVALIWHTGGTTGRPKACYHTHRRFLLAGRALTVAAGVAPGQRWAAAAPVGHALGFIYHTNYTLLAGATIVMIEDFTKPQVLLEAIATHRITTFTAIAATWAQMLDTVREPPDTDIRSVRQAYAMWQSASSTDVADGWQARGITLLNNFGSTSFATWVLLPQSGDAAAPTALGRPAPGYEIVTVDPESDPTTALQAGPPSGTGTGRMAVRGPSGLTYWNRPDLQRRDVVAGWSLVDDLVGFDDGVATYLGRTDFLVSTAGYKVAPVEVETVLAAHPAVTEVCVVGAPDAVRQEVVAAFVVVAPGHTAGPELAAALKDLAKGRLSPYKYPRQVHFVPALPRDHVGKVQPAIVRQWATTGVPA